MNNLPKQMIRPEGRRKISLTCHCLWTWRNKELHENNFVRPINHVDHVLKLSEDYYQARMANQITSNSQRVIDFIRWRPPPVNWAKLNTDGACKGGNIAGCGGIIRGSDGEWIGGYAKFSGDCSAFVAELWGVLEGLRYARRMGYRAVELNVDS